MTQVAVRSSSCRIKFDCGPVRLNGFRPTFLLNELVTDVDSFVGADLRTQHNREYRKLKWLRESIGQLEYAIKLNPIYFEAHVDLANAYAELHDYAEAINQLKKAIALRPDSALAHHNLGVIYFETRRLKEATESLKTAISLDPTRADALSDLGIVYLSLRQYKAALIFLEKSVHLTPTNNRARYHLGMVYFALKRKEKFWQEHATLKTFDSNMAQRLLDAVNQEKLLIVNR